MFISMPHHIKFCNNDRLKSHETLLFKSENLKLKPGNSRILPEMRLHFPTGTANLTRISFGQNQSIEIIRTYKGFAGGYIDKLALGLTISLFLICTRDKKNVWVKR
jgi:hypothetical protein